ncbi:HNH endonuclease [Catalinimonas niigatensis]|uniref:HNH endonuclease n=1 Tax=Catalinimonas niigatensis TaxID=1397264 RepID=UPI00266640E6|nr:HNH endonuclease [Catalinimonas niigatensis]WPP49116.1 HNH endonuclease [Catalinimonas niigatensis]
MERDEFSKATKQDALSRQKYMCGSCGEKIASINQIDKQSHIFGEGAHAHHMVHCQHGGTNLLSNCVILCESCHYTIHDGGNYRNKDKHLRSSSSDYSFFHG